MKTYKTDVLAALRMLPNSHCTANDLAVICSIPENHDSSPVTRGVIRELIEDGHCIGSTRAGYKLLNTGQEVQSYLNSLLRRQIAISKRIEAVYNGAVKKGIL